MLYFTLDKSLKVICKPFTMNIIRNMITLKYCRFNQFQSAIKNINPNTLASRLKELEETGIIKREIFDETPVRIEYSFTKKGKALLPILEKMVSYSLKYKNKSSSIKRKF